MPADQLHEGPITMTRKGFGFFAIGEEAEDLIIPPEWSNHALSGDIVKVAPMGDYRDPSGRMPPRAAGKVVEIVSRARETFVGTLIENDGLVMLEPDYKKMYVPIVISPSTTLGTIGSAPIGDKVVVRMVSWDAGKDYPLGTIEEVIGKAGDHETEMQALALGQGFSPVFPPGVIAEAKRLEENGRQMIADEVARAGSASSRRDFRSAPTCTIDPFDAKDFDDALSVRTL
ncbi:MAG: hypothetical protein WCW36_02715, partial [Candidatus Paceibacterota bacterium]